MMRLGLGLGLGLRLRLGKWNLLSSRDCWKGSKGEDRRRRVGDRGKRGKREGEEVT